MSRFVFGMALGSAAMYWYLTGAIPWEREVTDFLSGTASGAVTRVEAAPPTGPAEEHERSWNYPSSNA